MHFRMFFSSDLWLTAADLFDDKTGKTREVTLTVARVEKGHLVGVKGRKSTKPALHWKERQKDGSPIKPLGMCVANCSAISQVTGSTDMERWVGQQVTLYVEIIEMRGEGSRPAVRIRPFTAKQQRGARGDVAPEQPPSSNTTPITAEEAAEIARLEREGQ